MNFRFSVRVLIGGRELVMRVPGLDEPESTKEARFRVTKMRCWRIMTINGAQEADLDEQDQDQDLETSKLELSFEYLMASGDLQWVTIYSSQAILMSLCLQSMVEELLRMRSGVSVKKAGEKSCTSPFRYCQPYKSWSLVLLYY